MSKAENITNELSTKKDYICNILRNYVHDIDAEGDTIPKRRLWYILKPEFRLMIPSEIKKAKGEFVIPITNADFNREFNILAKAGEIDDTYILDNSRTMGVGEHLPHIIIATEKKTVESTVKNLAGRFGTSYYIAGGFSGIYAAKKLKNQIAEVDVDDNDIVVIVMSDYDKSGFEIVDTIQEHFGLSKAYIHRALITPSQVPKSKLGEYFDESVELGKHYELDVLNLDQLEKVFIDNIPADIAREIKASFDARKKSSIRRTEIFDAISENETYQDLTRKVDDLYFQLWEEYESAFLAADPINIFPYNLSNIVNRTVDYEVTEWRINE